MKRILTFIIVSIHLFTSCKTDGKEKDKLHLQDTEKENLNGEWIMLSKMGNDTIIYLPCDADNKTIVIKKDSIHINFGQEIMKYKMLNFSKEHNVFDIQNANNLLHLKFDKVNEKIYNWIINEKEYLFIKSEFSDSYKTVEQPCTECWSEEDCLGNKRNTICENSSLMTGYKFEVYQKEIAEDLMLNIIITYKKNNSIQKIEYLPYSNNFNCKAAKYSQEISIFNDYSWVIGDYNFDEKEDLAVLYDNTINTGTIFKFLFQDNHGNFYFDDSFPIQLIPTEINKKEKTLTQENIIGCCKIQKKIVQLQPNGEWKEVSSELTDI